MEDNATIYVGELIRKEIKDQSVTNMFVIKRIIEAGMEMSEAKFSNKLYGKRDTFLDTELSVINSALGTEFKLG